MRCGNVGCGLNSVVGSWLFAFFMSGNNLVMEFYKIHLPLFHVMGLETGIVANSRHNNPSWFFLYKVGLPEVHVCACMFVPGMHSMYCPPQQKQMCQ